jgi:spoIIIJ-associated protein
MEQPEWMAMSGKTVEEAIEVALKELDADRAEAEIEILSPGKPGFLGIRSEPARVRVRRIPAARGAAGLAMEIVNKILAATGTQTITTLKSAHDQDAGGPSIDITGEDSGLLIGRRGETLRALQFLVNLIVRNHLKEDAVRVVLDVERYKERRNNSLTDMALRVADKVAGTGRAVSLEPMPPAERRVVHMALADHPRVSTESSGLGDSRKVVIAPKTE